MQISIFILLVYNFFAGRGTSHGEGFALARAVVEYLHDRIGESLSYGGHVLAASRQAEGSNHTASV